MVRNVLSELEKQKSDWDKWRAWKKSMLFESYTTCFYCFLPQSHKGDGMLYSGHSGPGGVGPTSCLLDGVLPVLLCGVLNEAWLWDKACTVMPELKEVESSTEYSKWLVQWRSGRLQNLHYLSNEMLAKA